MTGRSANRQWLTGPGILATVVLLAGCSSLPQPTGPAPEPVVATGSPIPAEPADPTRTQAVFTALQMVGVPYQWGGESPSGFDCSGLVQFAYARAGLRLPRTAAAQLGAVTPVPIDRAEAGDLLFFRSGGRTSHVAIYLGNGRFVHAPSSGHEVSIDSFDNDYWRSHFVHAGRVPAPWPAQAGGGG
ncbi:MAG: NlpC/P60 family protein [Gammaproteobacteria bacterium PRO9]|nr:NlpC/P60 family protein [Gammaproteobacteria bacterium PRO9]